MKLLVDMNLSPRWVTLLTGAGIVVDWAERLIAALLLGLELFAADYFQRKEIGLRQLPYNGRSDAFVIVAQDVPDACHLAPRDVRMTSFQFICKVAACLGNYLDSAFDEPLPLPVSLENLQRHIPDHAANTLDGLDDVRETWNQGTGGH